MAERWQDEGQSTTKLAASPPSETALSLVVMIGASFSLRRLPERATVTLGRHASCDVQIDEASISREHARLSLTHPLRLEDLGSKNGTRVRDRLLRPNEVAEVSVGEAFKLGSVTLLLQRGPSLARASDSTLGRAPILLAPAMQAAARSVERLASSDLNVLILGETGVGKEVFAQMLHRCSGRAHSAFIALNCAAIPEALLEAELFGYERGAFTGADRAKAGLFEGADDGTVFLDEIGDLPQSVQAKLLRVLEERTITRVGGLKGRKLRARFVAATHRDLEAEIAAGRFRSDLFFRLSGSTLTIPPLRERPEEIEPLSLAFAADAAAREGRAATPRLSDETKALLRRHRWPGNVRELRNVMDRAIALSRGEVITPEHLPLGLREGSRPHARSGVENLKTDIQQLERDRILATLEACHGNQSEAARVLGIARRTLITRLEQYGTARPRKR